MTDDDTQEPTPAQWAAEPAHPALATWRLTPAAYDALARRVEAAAAPELARRAAAAPAAGSRPRLILRPARGAPSGRPTVRELTPLLARALRPAMLAAAAAGLLAVGIARRAPGAGDRVGEQLSDATAVQALNLHDPSAQWPDQASAPSADALGRAIGLGGAP